MADKSKKPSAKATGKAQQVSLESDVDAFLTNVRARPAPKTAERGRLVFAMDATMSRQPTWDQACHLQGEMFDETAKIGGLTVQLIYFRGFRECRASRWVDDAKDLGDLMSGVACRGGRTQIGRVLRHIKTEAKRKKINAAIYVGDCVEENIDNLCDMAGELGLLGVPLFVFQEGHDPLAQQGFAELARLTNGAYCRFDASSARQLRDLLSAVAVYAAGGRTALGDLRDGANPSAKLLLEQLGPNT